MKVSRFGQKIASSSGIGQLMEDLGSALSQNEEVLMLGGGNPAHIPEVQKYFRDSMEKFMRDGSKFEKTIGNYDPPRGNLEFIDAISSLLRNELGWNVKPENIALTNGSQMVFFILFNIFAGSFENGKYKKILFPLTPEYIGYCDVGLGNDLFTAYMPHIKYIDEHIYKYHINFNRMNITEEIGAICVSRPTNPTGNVLTDIEIKRLSEIACANDIPLIIDNAYGTPFPDIIYTQAKAIWTKNTIFCMSLSKLGLPAVRTGIIIASEEVIDMVSKVNAVMSLAPGGMGATIATDLVRSGEIIKISREIIKPFYEQKVNTALEQATKELDGLDYHIHKPEGAFFLWLWFTEIPIKNTQLYERLKKRGVLVVPGYYFFPGMKENWRHKFECIRVNYSQDAGTFAAGMKIIAEEVKRAYKYK